MKSAVPITFALLITGVNSPAFAEKCPFIGNGGVWELIKEGQVHDSQNQIWSRGKVFVVDGKSKQYKSYYPRELYTNVILAGGHEVTENSDVNGACMYEAEITKIEGQSDPKYYGDIIRVEATKKAVISNKCPFLGNGGVWDLIKEGRFTDDQKHTWIRGNVVVLDGKTKEYKGYFPRELYTNVIIGGGHETTEGPDQSGVCMYEADISNIEGKPEPKYFGDIIRVEAKEVR